MKTLITPDWNPRKRELIKDDETLSSAFSEFGREISTYDDGSGRLWVYSHEFSPTWIVRADSFESALECVYDEMEPIPASELYEAYGFDTEEEYKESVRRTDEEDIPDLIEGYSYQANATGTGIVNHGHYEGLTELTNEIIETLKISILIEGEDKDGEPKGSPKTKG
jgi:hypothetical protein